MRTGGMERGRERDDMRRSALDVSFTATSKRASTSPKRRAEPVASGASVTRAPPRNVPFALARSRRDQPSAVFSMSAWRRETERLARETSQSGSRPTTACCSNT